MAVSMLRQRSRTRSVYVPDTACCWQFAPVRRFNLVAGSCLMEVSAFRNDPDIARVLT